MASHTLTTATVTKILSGVKDVKVVWFQNFNTAVDFYLTPQQPASAPVYTTGEFKLPRAVDANTPGTLVLDTASVVCWDWYAYQASGGDAVIVCGQWKAPSS